MEPCRINLGLSLSWLAFQTYWRSDRRPCRRRVGIDLNSAHTRRPVKELDSYLNDHLAGSVSALELIAHWAHLHKGRPLGVFFSQTGTEIRADQSELRNLMRRLSVEESSFRQAGAWAAEKAGRVRLMIAGGGQGSLGLVLTLEGLIMGIVGKKLLWRSLAAANLAELNGYDFRELERRAEEQIDRIEAERIRAALLVLTDGAGEG